MSAKLASGKRKTAIRMTIGFTIYIMSVAYGARLDDGLVGVGGQL